MRQHASMLTGFIGLLATLSSTFLKAAEPSAGEPKVVLIELEDPSHEVMVYPAGRALKEPAALNRVLKPGDRIETGSRSRAAIRFGALTPFRMAPNSRVQIPDDSKRSRLFDLL